MINISTGYTRKTNRERGITLVALIITIIILVILAAVTIDQVFDLKIVETAINGTQNYTEAQIQEKEDLDDISKTIADAVRKTEIVEIKYNIGKEIKDLEKENNRNITDEELKEILEKYGTLSEEGEKIEDKTLTTNKGNYEIKVSDILKGPVEEAPDKPVNPPEPEKPVEPEKTYAWDKYNVTPIYEIVWGTPYNTTYTYQRLQNVEIGTFGKYPSTLMIKDGAFYVSGGSNLGATNKATNMMVGDWICTSRTSTSLVVFNITKKETVDTDRIKFTGSAKTAKIDIKDYKKGDFIERVYSTDKDAYEDDGKVGDFWYVKSET